MNNRFKSMNNSLVGSKCCFLPMKEAAWRNLLSIVINYTLVDFLSRPDFIPIILKTIKSYYYDDQDQFVHFVFVRV